MRLSRRGRGAGSRPFLDEGGFALGQRVAQRLVLAVILMAAAGNLTGCTPDTSTRGEGISTPTTTPAENAADRRCHRRRVGGVSRYNVAAPLQRLTQAVLASPEEVPVKPIARLQASVERIARRTDRACDTAPVAFLAMRDIVTALDPGDIDEPKLRELVAGYGAWTRNLGDPRRMEIVYEADPCDTVRRQVHAYYLVRYEPEPGGKRASVVLTLVNNWTNPVYLEHGGHARATGLRSTPAARTLSWGGSSADFAGSALPDRSVREMVWPIESGRTPWLHLDSTGNIRVRDFHGWLWVERSALDGCSIPVRPRPGN